MLAFLNVFNDDMLYHSILHAYTNIKGIIVIIVALDNVCIIYNTASMTHS